MCHKFTVTCSIFTKKYTCGSTTVIKDQVSENDYIEFSCE